MAFNAEQFLKDYNISHDAHHHHARPGWVAVQTCPFCGSNKYHFGISNTGAANCWKCGRHGLIDSIKKLCKATYGKAQGIIGKYGDGTAPKTMRNTFSAPKIGDKPVIYPAGTEAMKQAHRAYLEKRNFDPDKLEQEWGLLGVGATLGVFNNRIIVPITHNGVPVSYQGRDITGSPSRLRYRTCAKKEETRFHKHCLYGYDKAKGKNVLVTEGVTKVWRLGEGAVATFGIIWTTVQASLLLDYNHVFILFDKGEQAQEQADKLAWLLAGNIGGAEVIELEEYPDPGDMPQDEADILMRELKIRR